MDEDFQICQPPGTNMQEGFGFKVVCVQIDSKLKQPSFNAAEVVRLTSTLSSELVDLLILPELALTGYMFRSVDEIEPFLECTAQENNEWDESASPSLGLAQTLSRRLHCHVLIGFPEKRCNCDDNSAASLAVDAFDARPTASRARAFPTHSEPNEARFNSAALFSPIGSLVKVFRKHFLYEVDEAWAIEGPGFETITIPIGLRQVKMAVGICMDLNRECRTQLEHQGVKWTWTPDQCSEYHCAALSQRIDSPRLLPTLS